MNEIQIEKILYSLYVLCTYKEEENPTELVLNSLMINSIGTIDKSITDKNKLIEQIKIILKNRIKNVLSSGNHIIKFKIGDVITTSKSSSIIQLEFKISDLENNFFIEVLEKNKKTLEITI